MTLADVANVIARDVPRLQRNQTPVVDGREKDRFGDVRLIDRTRMTLVIRAKDSLDGHEITGAAVIIEGRDLMRTPATIEAVPRSLQTLFPWVEKPGYVAESHQVSLDTKDSQGSDHRPGAGIGHGRGRGA